MCLHLHFGISGVFVSCVCLSFLGLHLLLAFHQRQPSKARCGRQPQIRFPLVLFFWGAPCGLSCNTTRTRIHCQSSQFGSQTLGRMSAPFLATPLAWCGRTARLGLCDSSKLLYSMVRRKKRWLSRRRCCICRCIIVVAGWAAAKKKRIN